MKGFGWHEGDRSEYLAQFAFSTISYCSPVPRQFDHFGVDFYAHLVLRQERRLIATGRAIAAQVKSHRGPFLLDTPEQLKCFYESSVPFFVVVIDKLQQHMQVYCTSDRVHAYWEGWSGRVWVVPGDEATSEKPKGAVEGDRLLYLREPVFEMPLSALDDDAKKKANRELFFQVIDGWSKWDQINLAAKEAGMPVYVRINKCNTNHVPTPTAVELEHKYYPSSEYFEGYCRGMRVHIEVFGAMIADMQKAGATGGVPEFSQWVKNVRASIGSFLKVSELPPPAGRDSDDALGKAEPRGGDHEGNVPPMPPAPPPQG